MAVSSIPIAVGGEQACSHLRCAANAVLDKKALILKGAKSVGVSRKT